MNSSPIRNGKPKRILSTIVRLTLTRRSFGMHAELKGAKAQVKLYELVT